MFKQVKNFKYLLRGISYKNGKDKQQNQAKFVQYWEF